MRSSLLLLSPLLASACSPDACPPGSFRADDGLCTLRSDAGGDSGGGADGADGADGGDGADGSDGTTGTPGEFSEGDPILSIGTQGSASGGSGPDGLVEWTDAAMIDSRYGITGGQGGFQIVDMDTAEQVVREVTPRAVRLATNGSLLAMTTRRGQVLRYDVSDPTDPRPLPPFFLGGAEEEPNEDVAVDGELTLVGWTTKGGILIGAEGMEAGRIPADNAFAVGLSGDRAVLTDGEELTLWDISTPDEPVELDRVELPGIGRDADFDGQRVIVASGSLGVDLYTLTDDALVHDGHVDLPGSPAGVALDGDYAWVAAWQTTALLWIGEGGPALLGTEDPSQAAFGVGARDGRALVGDWFFASLYERQDGLASAEADVNELVWLPNDGGPALLPMPNWGYFDLEVEIDVPAGFTIEPSSFTVEPGRSTNVVVTPPASLDRDRTDTTVRTNDPDEAEIAIQLRRPEADIGTVHDPMELQGLQLPDTGLQTFNLADVRGKVVLLVYWALF